MTTTTTKTELATALTALVEKNRNILDRLTEIDRELSGFSAKANELRRELEVEEDRFANLKAQAIAGGRTDIDGRTAGAVQKRIGTAKAEIDDLEAQELPLRKEYAALEVALSESCKRLRGELMPAAMAEAERLAAEAETALAKHVAAPLIQARAIELAVGIYNGLRDVSLAMRRSHPNSTVDSVVAIPPAAPYIMRHPAATAIPDFWRVAGDMLEKAESRVCQTEDRISAETGSRNTVAEFWPAPTSLG